MRNLLIPALCLFLLIESCAQNPQRKEPAKLAASNNLIPFDTAWSEPLKLSDAEWKNRLSETEYYILRKEGTERAFTHPYNDNKVEGIYYCAACQNPLFSSDAKFNSGTGWPSFWKPLHSRSVSVRIDRSHGMVREEVRCARCDGHLGHVFDDGPKPTGLRYCMNGGALRFQEKIELDTVVFAQGCFWCVEEIFEKIRGVRDVVSGYSGGAEPNPTYEQVGGGATGHAEAVQIVYAPAQISYEQLLKVYFNSGDITQVNGQGPDRGPQYRSIIFYNNEAQRKAAEAYMANLEASGKYRSKIAVELKPRMPFYPAEAYHQDFVRRNPNQGYVRAVSIPRYEKAIKNFPELLAD